MTEFNWFVCFLVCNFTFRARGVYYLTTNADPPFARGHPAKQAERSNGDAYVGLRK